MSSHAEIETAADALPSEANPVKVSLKIDVNVAGQSLRGLSKLSRDICVTKNLRIPHPRRPCAR